MNYWARCVIYSFNWYFACFLVFLLTGQFEAAGIAFIISALALLFSAILVGRLKKYVQCGLVERTFISTKKKVSFLEFLGIFLFRNMLALNFLGYRTVICEAPVDGMSWLCYTEDFPRPKDKVVKLQFGVFVCL